MDYNTTRADTREWKTYVPAVDDVLSPPPLPSPTEPQPPTLEAGLGFVVTVANVLVTAVIVTAMLVDGQQAGKAIIYGAAYFALTTAGIALITTGSLTSMFAVWQREKTERERIDAYADAAEMVIQWRLTAEQNRARELADTQHTPRQLPAEGMQTPDRGHTFVAPYAGGDSTATEALRWANSLYAQDGQPDPAKVQVGGDNVGWLRIKAIGSKRGGGSEEAALWLRHRKFLRRVPGGYRVNLDRYPTRASLRNLR